MSIVDQESYSEVTYSHELANNPWGVFLLLRRPEGIRVDGTKRRYRDVRHIARAAADVDCESQGYDTIIRGGVFETFYL